MKSLRLRVETDDPLYRGQRKLKVKGKDLRKLPASVFNLLDLEVLDLSPERESSLDYRITRLSPLIGRLINLKVLMLDTNELQYVPSEICVLQNLERLSLSNNKLESLPKNFDQLRNLKSLHLANNNITEFPEQICRLTTLEFLDMSDNGLTSLPNSIENVSNMYTLLLVFNCLEALPESLSNLVELRCLWLGNNKISRLPQNFGKLVNLDWDYFLTSTTLEGNPLTHPPIEICRKGMVAIRRYLADRNLNTARKTKEDGGTQKSERDNDAEN